MIPGDRTDRGGKFHRQLESAQKPKGATLL
jgi:hypothetical protein